MLQLDSDNLLFLSKSSW